MADNDDNDRKAKDVLESELDPATRAELQRWFGLPSYQELEDKGIIPEDPDVRAVRERREQAIAAVDPELLESLRKRAEPRVDTLQFFTVAVELRIDPSIVQIDMGMIDRQASIAEPREVEISEALRDDLNDCTPQAILRDLHRPETDFDKTFEIIDMAAEQRFDIVAEVSAAMATNWKLPPLEGSPFGEARQLMLDVRAEQRQPWPSLLSALPLPNRRWAPKDDR